MTEDNKTTRLSKAAREFNVGISTIVEFLTKKGYSIDSKPNTKISVEIYEILVQEFQSEKAVKEKSQKIGLDYTYHKTISIEDKESLPEDIEKEKEPEELFIKNITVDYESEVISKKPEPVAEVEIHPEIIKADKKEEEKVEVAEKQQVKTDVEPKVVGKIDLDSITAKTRPARKTKEEKAKEAEAKKKTKKLADKKDKIPAEEKTEIKVKETTEEPVKEPEIIPETEETQEIQKAVEEPVTDKNFIPTEVAKLSGPKILDKIDLPKQKKFEKKPVASSKDEKVHLKKKKRKRIKKYTKPPEQKPDEAKDTKARSRFKGKRPYKEIIKPEVNEEEIKKQIKETLARLSPSGKSKASKYRKQKRVAVSQNIKEEFKKAEEDKSVIKVTEFVTANELANMINVPVNEIISTCMTLGLFVSINQRLDAETLNLVAEEFGYKVEFVSVDVQEAILEKEEDKPEDLSERTPIVTVMGHVDHGKTLLLDYIRKTNVIAGEAGGITQHIGAYEVTLENGKKIAFLDTPGHEAFTAMRARGAQVTDIAIIVIAADDNIMPQTKEAINHAQAAGVPLIFAINKIDKPNANPENIKEGLSKMNILVEDWGGKYQSQDISAKKGINIDELLEKVLLEAEMLELKGNTNKKATGTIIESSLDKGRGYVAKLMVQNGTLQIGDMVLAGSTYGKVKAMYNERNITVKEAGPSTPVLMLGLNAAPQAGDSFNVMVDEREVKAIANKRLQLQREQGIRTQKHITLDEIGRRLVIGDFKELNIIVKGDVDGSVEALSDSLLKLSNEEVQVNIIHRSVGAITESDVLLASASNAIIIGFQVRPTVGARKLAETEQIDIRLYSIIYQAIEELKSAIEGMLSPEIEEKITCNIEIREIYKITKVGTVAGCMVLDGKVTRNTKVRVIRDGIVVYTGVLGSLKRFKDDVKEVQTGYECGLNIENYNDIKAGDIIEGFEQVEVKRSL
ncbi:MAG: translation initiation factor IF-2 [Bacteroidetes bacterium]|nr:translation initiation factor IF-2 [Bacteroidota bacterium]